jgi:hypothetical protein
VAVRAGLAADGDPAGDLVTVALAADGDGDGDGADGPPHPASTAPAMSIASGACRDNLMLSLHHVRIRCSGCSRHYCTTLPLEVMGVVRDQWA